MAAIDPSAALQRSELLIGQAALGRLAKAKAIIFGVGGVGSWCAEAMVRSGVGDLTIVDADSVDISNLNRQLPATATTIGQPKASALADRLREIAPWARITDVQAFYGAENANEFDLSAYDAVVDAIDSLPSKSLLILRATAANVPLFSSMGAARRLDPGMVKAAEFWKVRGCPLARALRDRFRRDGVFPCRKFQAVYSDEQPKGEPKGTSMAVTATFGLRLASLVLSHLCR